jgi:hypothetical protein
MNEIQKANAKVVVEYWQKILDGNPCAVRLMGKNGLVRSLDPDFKKCDVGYFLPPEMVEHKGGGYPKPVARKDIIEGRQYYAPDPLGKSMYDYVAAKDSSVMFHATKGREMLHETKEAAIAHAKVMLGVSDE